jgi:hypothetical protein
LGSSPKASFLSVFSRRYVDELWMTFPLEEDFSLVFVGFDGDVELGDLG